jgi:hypothetical protein
MVSEILIVSSRVEWSSPSSPNLASPGADDEITLDAALRAHLTFRVTPPRSICSAAVDRVDTSRMTPYNLDER